MPESNENPARDPENIECECKEFIGDNFYCPRHYPAVMEVPC